jgi:putative intracellular protease/amidase/YHS domain-containing protein
MAAAPFSLVAAGSYELGYGQSAGGAQAAPQNVAGPSPLTLPSSGIIPVAFPISDGAVVIDFSGPWEVFQDATAMDAKGGFQLYTVAEKSDPIRSSGGMMIVPNYTFENAPPPKVIVIAAQSGVTEAMLRWIRESTKNADVTMSVCTGAFVLAKTGLLSGKAATTHHNAYTDLAMQYPDIHVKRGYRFVEEGKLATSGGLTSGMDLAFRVVERYYGREKAENTALDMEYQGKGWMDASGAANAIYAKAPSGPVCQICEMSVDAKTALTSVYKGHKYYFCSHEHKATFDEAPEKALRLATTP